MARLNNGKLIDGNYHRGDEIMLEIPRGRRVVHMQGKVVKNLDPRKNYSPEDMRRMRVMPDRSKGGYYGNRSALSRQVIHKQIVAVSEEIFKNFSEIDFDDRHYDWMTVVRYQLPPSWSERFAPLMILFPTEYPELPPVGFYLPDHIVSPNGHLMAQAYHGADSAPIQRGWNWYCVYVNPGSWRPAYGRYAEDWRKGDNLFEYLALVGESLAGSH